MDASLGHASTTIPDGLCHLQRLYVYNEKFGNDTDNEMGKVLYFHPSGTDEDTQLKQMGLSEAIIKFATKFNIKIPCESLHTQKSRHVFHSPEPGYWFVLVLSIPCVKRLSPEGVEFIEYLGDEVQDDVFKVILEKLYKKFVLLNDTLEIIFNSKGLDELRLRLKKFIDMVIGKFDPAQCGVSEMFTGLQFFPLERSMFLRIQCCINKLLLSWPSVKHVLLMQGDRLIWSGIEQTNIQIFYDYLVNDLLSKHFLTGADKQSVFGMIYKRECHITLLQEDHSSCSQSFTSLYTNHTNALNTSVISNSHDTDNTSFMTASTSTIEGTYKEPGPVYKKYHMLIYKAEQTYLTLLIPETEELSKETVNKLESFLNVNFTSLARQLAKVPCITSQPPQAAATCSLQNPNNPAMCEGPPPNVKFIYFNSLNLAERASPAIRCEIDAYKLLADLRADLARTTESGEITMKAVSETWVVAKTANGREFYAIFNQTGANVLDIDEELRKITDAQLTNIFFQD